MEDRQGEKEYRGFASKGIEMKTSKKEKGGNKKGMNKDYNTGIL